MLLPIENDTKISRNHKLHNHVKRAFLYHNRGINSEFMCMFASSTKKFMSKKKQIYLLFSCLIGILMCTSCFQDRQIEYQPRIDANKWIVEEMRNIYYWYQDIPDDSKLNFFAEPDVFFGTILSSNDSKSGNNYSWIEPSTGYTPEDTPTESYGFDYKLYVKQSANRSFARILYVIPGSPADNAGIKRGDWLATFGDYRITANNEEMLQTGGASYFTLAKYEVTGMGEDEKPIYDWVVDSLNVIPIEAARKVSQNPVLVNKTLSLSNGQKAAYLMYNYFISGNTAESDEYIKELGNIINSYKGNINDFILDLRYNKGGSLETSRLFTSMLAPATALGDIFYTAKYNDKNQDKNKSTYLESSGTNLNLKKIYVIIGNKTAGAGEALINALLPYMGEANVILIGSTTAGDNAMTEAIQSDTYPWIIHPTVAMLYNKNDKSDYYNGFTPTLAVDESADYSLYKELGDPEELLLSKTIDVIINGLPTEDEDGEETETNANH